MQYVDVAIRCLLAVVFVAAVLGKVRGRDAFGQFRSSVAQFGVPERLVGPAALATVAGEVVTVPLLAVPATVPLGYLLAILLLAGFTLGMTVALVRGRRPACRCFGNSTAPIGRPHLVRNAILIALAVAGLVIRVAGATGPVEPAGLALGVVAALPLAALVIRLDDLVALFAPVGTPVAGPRRR